MKNAAQTQKGLRRAVQTFMLLLVHKSMRTIPLTQGKYAIVDDEDYEDLRKWKWHLDNRYSRVETFYAKRTIYPNGKPRALLMHRYLIKPSNGMFVDHINGNGLDNRRCNLRVVNRSQNGMNLHRIVKNKVGGCKFKGVSFHTRDRQWIAKIGCGGKQHWLGAFENQEDAAICYNVAAQLFFGEFARLNDV